MPKQLNSQEIILGQLTETMEAAKLLRLTSQNLFASVREIHRRLTKELRGDIKLKDSRTYTVICRRLDGLNSLDYDTVDAISPAEARKMVSQEMSSRWGVTLREIKVVGVIRGEAKVLSWSDE
jgi:hypothetical protein